MVEILVQVLDLYQLAVFHVSLTNIYYIPVHQIQQRILNFAFANIYAYSRIFKPMNPSLFCLLLSKEDDWLKCSWKFPKVHNKNKVRNSLSNPDEQLTLTCLINKHTPINEQTGRIISCITRKIVCRVETMCHL